MQRWWGRFPAKWTPVRVRKARQDKKPGASVPIQSGRKEALVPADATLCGKSCPSKEGCVRSSDVEGYFRAGLFQLGLQGGELVGEFIQCAVVKFREDEFVQRLLLRGQICQMLVGLVGERHLHDAGIFG